MVFSNSRAPVFNNSEMCLAKYLDRTAPCRVKDRSRGCDVTLTFNKGEPLIFHRRVLGFLSRDCKMCGTKEWDQEAPALTRRFSNYSKCKTLVDPVGRSCLKAWPKVNTDTYM